MSFKGRGTVVAPQRITSWSASRLKTYEQCPAKCKYIVLDKLSEPETEPILAGKQAHKALEDFIKQGGELPPELEKIHEILVDLRDYQTEHRNRVQSEMQVAFNVNLEQVTWFDKSAWLRCVLDVLVLNEDKTAVVADLKTGKRRKEDDDQLSLFALAVLLLFPEVETVITELWYSKDGSTVSKTYTRGSLGEHKAYWMGRAAPMLEDTEFLPRPNALCGWCHFRKSNQGPCKFA